MTDTQQRRELADDYLNHDLQVSEDYLHAAIAAHNLALQFNRLMRCQPTGGEEHYALYENYYNLTTARSTTMRLFEQATSRIGRTPYDRRAAPPEFAVRLADARKRLDSLKQGKRQVIGPTIDARTAGFAPPDDYPGLEPFR